MTNHPPAFASQIEEQAKWNEGFVAGVKEVLAEVETSTNQESEDQAQLVEVVKLKMQKYL